MPGRDAPAAAGRGERREPTRRRALGGGCAALLCLGGTAGPAAPRAAERRHTGLPARMAGAFVLWGSEGRERTLAAWEARLGREPGSVPGLDFYGGDAWADFADRAWLPGLWRRLNPGRRLVWSVPLTVPGTDLAAVADGLHDDAFRQAAAAIAEAQPDAAIRIGWEMNVAGSAWLAAGREAVYIRAYRRVVAIFRARGPSFTYDWCPGWGNQAGPAEAAYPGDDVVDTVGLDVYDFTGGADVQARWRENYLDAPYGLTWHRDFALRHGKRMSYPEWGVGQAGDNPYFVERMAEWFAANAPRIAYALYFDADGTWPTRIDAGAFPRSDAALLRRFSGEGR